jgi:hypothetical protein
MIKCRTENYFSVSVIPKNFTQSIPAQEIGGAITERERERGGERERERDKKHYKN